MSTLTIVFVYVHVRSFYNGPFEFESALGESLRIVLLLPALIATPIIVMFNFYPRIVLRKLFERDVDREMAQLTERLRFKDLSEAERMSYLIEYDRLAREDIKGQLQLSLSDLPIAVTLILMVIGIMVEI